MLAANWSPPSDAFFPICWRPYASCFLLFWSYWHARYFHYQLYCTEKVLYCYSTCRLEIKVIWIWFEVTIFYSKVEWNEVLHTLYNSFRHLTIKNLWNRWWVDGYILIKYRMINGCLPAVGEWLIPFLWLLVMTNYYYLSSFSNNKIIKKILQNLATYVCADLDLTGIIYAQSQRTVGIIL